MSLKIVDYSPKSFVITGETSPHKENLKKLGGKWNSRLKCKDSDGIFGGWIFWMNKKEEVSAWINKSCGDVVVINDDGGPAGIDACVDSGHLENRVILLEKQARDLEKLWKDITGRLNGFILEKTGEEYSSPQFEDPPKR